MEYEIDKAALNLLREDSKRRQNFFIDLLKICEPQDLVFMEQNLAEYKRDFFVYLPNEIVEIIIGFLDWKSLLNCCLVSKTWNKKISFNFNTFWYQMCLKYLPINQIKQNDLHHADMANRNFKKTFVQIMNESDKLVSGANFKSTSFGPVEIEAIYTFKNIVATATHIVKFWTMNPISCEWSYYKKMTLQSRAQKFSFNDNYLLASTYFMTIGLYSLDKEQFLYEYIGHTCSVTSFAFDDTLKLIVSGSADGTVKFWPMQPEERIQSVINKPIYSVNNLEWITSLNIDHYESNDYVVIILAANCICHINLVQKIDDFEDPNSSNTQDTFRFRYNLKILEEYFTPIDLNYSQDDNDQTILISNKSWISFNDKTLNLFLIAENNSNQNKKVFFRKFLIEKNAQDQCFEVEMMPLPVNDKCLDFLNKRFLNEHGINRFEIISLGLNFCLFVDEDHSFYMANLKSQLIKKIDSYLNFDPGQKFYRILVNSIQEQFVLGDKNWLNGFSLKHEIFPLKKNCFPLVFYSYRRNECFVLRAIV